jgi:hypothetical protein
MQCIFNFTPLTLVFSGFGGECHTLLSQPQNEPQNLYLPLFYPLDWMIYPVNFPVLCPGVILPFWIHSPAAHRKCLYVVVTMQSVIHFSHSSSCNTLFSIVIKSLILLHNLVLLSCVCVCVCVCMLMQGSYESISQVSAFFT